jgi:hypothetical protein
MARSTSTVHDAAAMQDAPSTPAPAAWRRRSFWLNQIRQWHWISASLCLTAMLLFAATGVTLNHAQVFEPAPRTATRSLPLPPEVAQALARGPAEGAAPLPAAVAAWARTAVGVESGDARAEWSTEEVTLSLPHPGGERSLAFDRRGGGLTYGATSRGLVGTLNDLHTGRNSGRAWGWFIDIFAAGCLVFAVTGLVLLTLYARGRRATWPLLLAGAAAPLLLATLLLMHLSGG